jgi:hypothetical protein
MADRPVWVLLRKFDSRHGEDNDDPGKVLGVYATREQVDARVARIGEANPQHPLRRVNDHTWAIGPEDDEGFFGGRPVRLYAIEATLTENVTVSRRDPEDG